VSAQSPLRADATAPVFGYSVQQTYPHDANAFTQGLEYVGGYLYESTGLNGRSSIRKVKLETGAVLKERAVSRDYFGEGITVWKTEIQRRRALGADGEAEPAALAKIEMWEKEFKGLKSLRDERHLEQK